jgi:hypothetical protein
MLLLGRAVAPRCRAPEGPASVAPAGATDRDWKAVENMNGITGRKHEVQDPLLDQRQRRALPGEGLIGSKLGFWAAGSAGGISPPAAHRTVRKPLDLHGSPLPSHLAMTVDAESDRSSQLLGWRAPSLSWVIRFAPRSLQVLRRYYRMIRPRHAHRYFPPSCFALIRFSLGMA